MVDDMPGQQMNPSLEKGLMEYQNIEKQYQAVMLQKHQLQLQLNEIDMAMEELKTAEGDIFKSVGSIMVKTSKGDAESDLKERKTLIEKRLETLDKQELQFRTKLEDLQKRLEGEMRGMNAGGKQ